MKKIATRLPLNVFFAILFVKLCIKVQIYWGGAIFRKNNCIFAPFFH
jgi:hypothetical protein